jgi:hypothetical protein
MEIKHSDQTGVLVYAQHLSHLGRAMPEHGEKGFHTLPEQAEDKGFR